MRGLDPPVHLLSKESWHPIEAQMTMDDYAAWAVKIRGTRAPSTAETTELSLPAHPAVEINRLSQIPGRQKYALIHSGWHEAAPA
jgi:hypothetical protein